MPFTIKVIKSLAGHNGKSAPIFAEWIGSRARIQDEQGNETDRAGAQPH